MSISNLPVLSTLTIKTATSTATATIERTKYGEICFTNAKGHKVLSNSTDLKLFFEVLSGLDPVEPEGE